MTEGIIDLFQEIKGFVDELLMSDLPKGLFIIYWEYGTGVLWEKPMENVLVPSAKISKKVGVPSVEGRKKVHVPYNYTILTMRWRHNMP